MRALLRPVVVRELGLAVFRVGQELLPLFSGRVIIDYAPEHMIEWTSGALPPARQSLGDDPALAPFFANEKVIQAAGGFNGLEAWLMRQPIDCQWPHSDYHHNELVTTRFHSGSIRLCWHCDNKLRDHHTEQLSNMAKANVVAWIIDTARIALRFNDSHILTLPELCWWATTMELVETLPEGMARRALDMPQDVILSVSRESRIVHELSATSIVQEKVKPVLKLKVDPESPATLIRRPKRIRWENPNFIKWVKIQPCEGCGSPADDPHHLIGWGQGGMGTKAHDLLSIPLCRICHTELHNDPVKFEQKHGSQPAMIIRILDRACALGVLA
ncbi:DUF968 domain-containing protein [Buttiauxella sp. WJP83]|uniref:DUF968 domain-containing protein n=1 Tax=Buttiauxella sp. WJP83 TaxID=2986951 RepID=UPI0022DE4E51|nr:DUF968 domain-containing protein [Buttiauxella sp. WJP83]WBM69151.1 DUF968 domain-containing protein [Buttiauxella sp. WJP83]